MATFEKKQQSVHNSAMISQKTHHQFKNKQKANINNAHAHVKVA